jgi:CRISPR/Cas system CSM-associated protein Csm3 (group 7 of RAMP superfamily)
MFGNTSLASRVRIEDAYPDRDKPKPKLEERNGVAIDRVFGSVAVGPLIIKFVPLENLKLRFT